MDHAARLAPVFVLVLLGCGSSESDPAAETSTGSTSAASGSGGDPGTGGSGASGGRESSGGAGATGGGAGGVPSSGRYIDEIFDSVTVDEGIVYGEAPVDGTPQELLLDLYQPEGDDDPARAAIVWIHGGGFVGGSRSDPHLVELATRFAKRGYVTVSIDYRLLGPDAAGVLAAEADARAAVRWFRKNAALYSIDEARIAIGGSSAGGITSLFVAYDETEGDSGNPGFSSEVDAVVDLWGALYQEPLMEAGEAPVLIVHGTEDMTVPFSEAEELVARAREVGVPYEFHPIDGAGHGPWQGLDDYIGWSAPFLYQHVILP